MNATATCTYCFSSELKVQVGFAPWPPTFNRPEFESAKTIYRHATQGGLPYLPRDVGQQVGAIGIWTIYGVSGNFALQRVLPLRLGTGDLTIARRSLCEDAIEPTLRNAVCLRSLSVAFV
jgi:hypothetical protein